MAFQRNNETYHRIATENCLKWTFTDNKLSTGKVIAPGSTVVLKD